MPDYAWIDPTKDKRTAEGLLRLKDGLITEGIPARTVQDTLLLATWNLWEFGQSMYGYRSKEALAYIYRPEDEVAFAPDMGEAYSKTKTGAVPSDKDRTSCYLDWRTFQISDHFPMWIELKTDFSREYLSRKL
jgi:hypothetical protein